MSANERNDDAGGGSGRVVEWWSGGGVVVEVEWRWRGGWTHSTLRNKILPPASAQTDPHGRL